MRLLTGESQQFVTIQNLSLLPSTIWFPTWRREVHLLAQPHHLCKVLTVNHNDATGLVIRAVMITMEMELAAKAPHDVVFLDGSLTTPVIHLNPI